MSTIRNWAELASQNERLALPSDLTGGSASPADPYAVRAETAEPIPDISARPNPPLARSA
jgi:hypothetical protein